MGLPRVFERVCARAGIERVTLHTLRHTFTSVAGNLNFSELTIAGLLGHAARGVTQGYVHLDQALVLAAGAVSAQIARLLDGDRVRVSRTPSNKHSDELDLAEWLIASVS